MGWDALESPSWHVGDHPVMKMLPKWLLLHGALPPSTCKLSRAINNSSCTVCSLQQSPILDQMIRNFSSSDPLFIAPSPFVDYSQVGCGPIIIFFGYLASSPTLIAIKFCLFIFILPPTKRYLFGVLKWEDCLVKTLDKDRL